VDLPVSEVSVFLDSIGFPFEHVVVMPDINKLRKTVFGTKSGVIFQGRFLGQRRRIILKLLIPDSIWLIKRSQFICCVLELIVVQVLFLLQWSFLREML
jgi:hypothetical protein